MPEAPAEQDQPIDALEAPETDQPEGANEESFTDSYNPSELSDDVRPHVEAAYKQLQSAYTSKTQSLAEERREAEQAKQIMQALQNPQVAPAVLANLGYDEKKLLEMYGYSVGDDEPADEPDLYDEVEGLKQWKAQQEQTAKQAAQEEAVTDYIAENIEAMEKKAQREFTTEEQQLLDAYARAYAKNGVPDVEGAYNLLTGALKSREKALLDPKRNTPRPPGGGKPGSRTVDLSKESDEEFVNRMAQAVDAARASAQ